MHDWAARACDLLAAGRPTALVSILATEGSAPRGAGVRMVVTSDFASGTVGGGNLEYQAIAQARRLLEKPPGDWRVQDYPLGPFLGQCCGGRVRLLLERLCAEDASWLASIRDQAGPAWLQTLFAEGRLERRLGGSPSPAPAARGPMPGPGDRLTERIGEDPTPVALFGAGHVGEAVARTLKGLPFSVAWFDTRPEAALNPGVALSLPDDLVFQAASAAPETCLLIMTHDHGLDYRLAAAALTSPARFIGLIGSRTKKARFLGRLTRDGLGEAARSRLVCPIGLEGIHGKAPEVIAIAVAAQLLMLRARDA